MGFAVNLLGVGTLAVAIPRVVLSAVSDRPLRREGDRAILRDVDLDLPDLRTCTDWVLGTRTFRSVDEEACAGAFHMSMLSIGL